MAEVSGYYSIRKKILKRFLQSIFVVSSVRIFLLRKMGFVIGKNVYISDGFFVSDRSIDKNHVIIGDRVEIGPNVTMIATSGPTKFSKWKHVYRLKVEVITVMHDAWIGTGSIIMPGVIIGEFSIVAVGTVVSESIPPFSYATGNPMTIKALPDTLINKLKAVPDEQ